MKRNDARRVLIVLRGTERRDVEAAAKRARLPLATWARVAAVNAAVSPRLRGDNAVGNDGSVTRTMSPGTSRE